jgi:hypothetical protein
MMSVMPAERRTRIATRSFVLALAAWAASAPAWALPEKREPSELIGTWRGTSTCADRVAAPACRDEVVVYDFTAGEEPGSVHWKADKVVDGQRQFMGEFDLVYDTGDRCWAAEFTTPRFRLRWCVVVDGGHLTGTGRQLPEGQTIRKIDARKD